MEGSQPAWEEFIRRFHAVIAGTVTRCARRFCETTPELIDDLVQQTLLKICANRYRIVRDFEPQSPDAIIGFLKTVAFNVTLDYFRIGMTEKRGSDLADAALETYAKSTVADSEGLPKVEREILFRPDRRTPGRPAKKTGVRATGRIFWLYYRHGMTARTIAAIPGLGLTQKAVESVIQCLTSHVQARLGRATCRPPARDPAPAGRNRTARKENLPRVRSRRRVGGGD